MRGMPEIHKSGNTTPSPLISKEKLKYAIKLVRPLFIVQVKCSVKSEQIVFF